MVTVATASSPDAGSMTRPLRMISDGIGVRSRPGRGGRNPKVRTALQAARPASLIEAPVPGGSGSRDAINLTTEEGIHIERAVGAGADVADGSESAAEDGLFRVAGIEDEIGKGAAENEIAEAFAILCDEFQEIEEELRQRLAALQPETNETA